MFDWVHGIPILSIICYLPLLGALFVIFFMKKENTAAIRSFATLIALVRVDLYRQAVLLQQRDPLAQDAAHRMDTEDARRATHAAAAIAERLEDTELEGSVELSAARVARIEGRLDVAAQKAARAASLFRAREDRGVLAASRMYRAPS